MKLQMDQLAKLQKAIQDWHRKTRLLSSDIAVRSGVSQGQTSRILRGEFRTLSCNVMLICNSMGLDAHAIVDSAGAIARSPKNDAHHVVIESALSLWDGTPEGAQVLARLFTHLGQLRRVSKIPRKRTHS